MKLKIGGIVFEISFPLAAVMTAVILFDSSLSVVVCFLSVIFHESGHLVMLHHFGCMPESIRLTLFDIAIVDKSKSLRGFSQEIAVVMAGIAFNFLFGTAALILLHIFSGGIWELFVNANYTLAFFNLLPAETLDGGQALLLILCRKMEMRKAMITADIISVVIIIPLGILGFIVLLRSKYNFSLLLTAIYLLAVLLMKHPLLPVWKKQKK